MSVQLKGKVALVTGAGAGIGRGIALALAREGVVVYAIGRQLDTLKTLVAEARDAGGEVHALAADIGDPAQINKAMQTLYAQHGQVDIAINNAGVMYLAPIRDGDWQDGIRMIQTNLIGSLNIIYEVLPGMTARKAGDILNFSSISARLIGPGTAIYAATKRAIEVVTESLRQELAGSGVRVGCLQLGGVATELNDKIRNKGMRRLIKMRSQAYHDLPIDMVVNEVLHILTRPRNVNLANTFLLSSDQAS